MQDLETLLGSLQQIETGLSLPQNTAQADTDTRRVVASPQTQPPANIASAAPTTSKPRINKIETRDKPQTTGVPLSLLPDRLSAPHQQPTRMGVQFDAEDLNELTAMTDAISADAEILMKLDARLDNLRKDIESHGFSDYYNQEAVAIRQEFDRLRDAKNKMNDRFAVLRTKRLTDNETTDPVEELPTIESFFTTQNGRYATLEGKIDKLEQWIKVTHASYYTRHPHDHTSVVIAHPVHLFDNDISIFARALHLAVYPPKKAANWLIRVPPKMRAPQEAPCIHELLFGRVAHIAVTGMRYPAYALFRFELEIGNDTDTSNLLIRAQSGNTNKQDKNDPLTICLATRNVRSVHANAKKNLAVTTKSKSDLVDSSDAFSGGFRNRRHYRGFTDTEISDRV
jgi:hypothetical protein